MWELLELADGVGTIGEFVQGLARGAREATPGAFDDPEEHPDPVVPEPPPQRLPDTGWDEFAPPGEGPLTSPPRARTSGSGPPGRRP